MPPPDKLRWIPAPSHQNAEARTGGYRMATKGRATVKGNTREFHINPSDTFLAPCKLSKRVDVEEQGNTFLAPSELLAPEATQRRHVPCQASCLPLY